MCIIQRVATIADVRVSHFVKYQRGDSSTRATGITGNDLILPAAFSLESVHNIVVGSIVVADVCISCRIESQGYIVNILRISVKGLQVPLCTVVPGIVKAIATVGDMRIAIRIQLQAAFAHPTELLVTLNTFDHPIASLNIDAR